MSLMMSRLDDRAQEYRTSINTSAYRVALRSIDLHERFTSIKVVWVRIAETAASNMNCEAHVCKKLNSIACGQADLQELEKSIAALAVAGQESAAPDLEGLRVPRYSTD